MVMLLAPHPMEFVFLKSLDLLSRACSYVADFTRNNLLTENLLKQGYQHHIFRYTLFLI